MAKVKIGLIGLGFMGSTHFRIHRGLPNAEIVALADVDPVKLKGDVSKVIGNIGGGDNTKPLDMTGIKTYNNAMDLINDPNVEMVDICAPTTLHAEFVIAALKAGKHVFGEKPLCRNLEEMKKIAAAVKASDKFFNCGMCVRAWPEYYHFRQEYASGIFGKVITANFRRLSQNIAGNAWQNWFMNASMSGGALLDLHLHDTDFIRFVFGRPKTVRTVGVKGIVSDNGIDHSMTVYDFADSSMIISEGGWIGAKTCPFEMSFQVMCEKATVRFMSEGYKIYWHDGKIDEPKIDVGDLPTGWHQEIKYFVDCILSKTAPTKYQTLQDITDAYCMIMAEQESFDTNKIVEVKYV